MKKSNGTVAERFARGDTKEIIEHLRIPEGALEAQSSLEDIRKGFRFLAGYIEDTNPPSRELSLVFTHLETAWMWYCKAKKISM